MDQNELDRSMNGMSESLGGGNRAAKKDKGDNLLGDDVQKKALKSKKEATNTEEDKVCFDELVNNHPNKGPNDKGSLDMEFLLDIPLNLTVELGRNRLLINELLQLGQGSVIELTKLAGEPMDIYVNQRLIARGEVVVVNQKFGVRLTEIVSPAERGNRFK